MHPCPARDLCRLAVREPKAHSVAFERRKLFLSGSRSSPRPLTHAPAALQRRLVAGPEHHFRRIPHNARTPRPRRGSVSSNGRTRCSRGVACYRSRPRRSRASLLRVRADADAGRRFRLVLAPQAGRRRTSTAQRRAQPCPRTRRAVATTISSTTDLADFRLPRDRLATQPRPHSFFVTCSNLASGSGRVAREPCRD